MWFKYLSLTLCVACITKSTIGLFFHDRFYAWDKKQYASMGWPLCFLFFIPYGIIFFSFAWYATIAHYVEYGWILTLVATVGGVKLLNILFNWRSTSAKFVELIEKNKIGLWVLDGFVFVMGVSFAFLAVCVYS